MVKCPYCGREAEMVTGSRIYPHRKDLRARKFWACEPCDARIETRMYSNHPAGTLANANLRGLRKRVREVFDPIWRSGPISEKNAKQQLAEILQIEVQDCDIDVFDEPTCERVLHLLRPEEEE